MTYRHDNNCHKNNSSGCHGVHPKCSDNILITNLEEIAEKNDHYRKVVWTAPCMQITVMCIPECSDIGVEIHEDTDQMIRVEQGYGSVRMGASRNDLCFTKNVCPGDIICAPAGTWHNVINTGNCPLKLSSIYSPPHHPRDAVQRTKSSGEGMAY